jgi:hypothetical protein
MVVLFFRGNRNRDFVPGKKYEFFPLKVDKYSVFDQAVKQSLSYIKGRKEKTVKE